MLVTHQSHTVIPATATSPLHLNDVLVSPSLIKNLISVRHLTRDNNISIELDPSGFSIKDLLTRAETVAKLEQIRGWCTCLCGCIDLCYRWCIYGEILEKNTVFPNFEWCICTH